MENKNYSVITLVLGILSLALMLLGWGALVGLGCGIAAIIFAKKATNMSNEKDTKRTVGYICGIVGTVLSSIAIIILIIALFVGKSLFGQAPDLFDKNYDKAKEQQEELLDQAKEQQQNLLDQAKEQQQALLDQARKQ